MRVMLAKLLGAVGGLIVILAGVMFVAVFALCAGIAKLFDWVELHATYKGDRARQDRAHWKEG